MSVHRDVLRCWILPVACMLGSTVAGPAGSGAERSRPAAPVPALTAGQIEADWLRQGELRGKQAPTGARVMPREDAPGGCDGVINGKWGFHTENEQRPWWQVDLGKVVPLDRVVLYNRCDSGCASRTARIMLLLSQDGKDFRQVYQHDGTVFYGRTDNRPLVVPVEGAEARYVRLQLPGKSYFHLDEVEVYAVGGRRSIALGKPATQSTTSQWSVRHAAGPASPKQYATAEVVQRGLKLAEGLRRLGADPAAEEKTLREVAAGLDSRRPDASDGRGRAAYLRARRAVRKMALKNPLLDFESIVFVKRAPGAFPHMSDQFYGWWSRPGGGIYRLEGFKGDSPRLRCLTEGWPEGNFLRPDVSYDGRRIAFAYCKFYPGIYEMEKVDKQKLPEEAFYQIYEMDVDGGGVRRLTRGKYDDFDVRYLPDGELVFLSTRKGQRIQSTRAGTEATCGADLPDSYVRCGGGNTRPVPVFTLHRMDADGKNLRPISAFENFEWTPSVAADGRILYARWDYIDRFNGPFMSLWSTNPDGTNPQLVYGNFTARPQCVFEARPVPDSHKLVFTAAAHHSNMGGSLVLLDRRRGTEHERPLERLTPEVCFPETEGWPNHYYANPYPLSEEYFLVAWSDRRLPPHSFVTTDEQNPANATGIYLYDAFGNLELLYRDPQISSMYPLPLRPRTRPPALPDTVAWDGPQEGGFLLQDVYLGLEGVEAGSIKRLRIVAVPPKVQPQMNSPVLGVSREDPGKYVLGTVPVEEDGSAYFRVPSGVPVFFQAIDGDGLAVQTMRTLTYVQAGQRLSCIGCHEHRDLAPRVDRPPLAARREPSKLRPGPEGSWPLRFDRLVQPVLDRLCVECHRPEGSEGRAARFDLTAAHSYANLVRFAENDLQKLAFEKDRSIVGDCPARRSKLLAMLTREEGHEGVRLDADARRRLVTWMDTYAQKQGSFSEDQARQLRTLRESWARRILSDEGSVE